MKTYPAIIKTVLFALVAHSAAIQAQTASPALEDYLRATYYEIEFFVFERPEVLDVSAGERLALSRPRALPAAMRTQRLDPQRPWTLPVDPFTRACFSFPTLSYELLPPVELDDRFPTAQAQRQAEPVALPRDVPSIAPVLGRHPLLDFMADVAAFERSLAERSQRWLEPETFMLAREAARVERRGLGRVLFHGRWLQVPTPRETPDPIFIQAGAELSYPIAVHELEGTVGVSVGRYLHFQADLYFHAPGLGMPLIAVARRTDGTPVMDELTPLKPAYMALTESRRMRSGEIHYLDHPKLGLVVRIDPVGIPDGLVESFNRLEEDVE